MCVGQVGAASRQDVLIVRAIPLVGFSMIPWHPRPSVAVVANVRATESVGCAVWVGAMKKVAVKKQYISRLHWNRHRWRIFAGYRRETVYGIVEVAHIFHPEQVIERAI